MSDVNLGTLVGQGTIAKADIGAVFSVALATNALNGILASGARYRPQRP